MIDLVIFDCDGTLVDSEYMNAMGVVELFKAFGCNQYDVQYVFDNFCGFKLSDLVQRVAEENNVDFPDNMEARYVDIANDLAQEHLKPCEGAFSVVETLAKNYKICVGSNGERDNVLFNLKLADLVSFFPEKHVFTASQVGVGKPAPDLFLHAAREMESVAENVIVIEDSVAGVQAAVAAGMKVLGYTGTSQNDQEHRGKLEEAGANSVIAELSQIHDHLEA